MGDVGLERAWLIASPGSALQVKPTATGSDGCGRRARLRDSPDGEGMWRLEEKEGMSVLRFDQREDEACIGRQGKLPGVRGTERTMFEVN